MTPDHAHVRAAGRIEPALVAAVNQRLDDLVPAAPGAADRLCEAMRHALLGPGKRVRAVLTVLAGRELGAPPAPLLAAGCALEMLHAASLVLDDLPSMDDARQRRGQWATHVVYGEAVATLAAIGLIARAFSVVASVPGLDGGTRAGMAATLARSIGIEGLCGGQFDDLEAGPEVDTMATLARIGHRKTGALFVAAVELGAGAAGVADDRLRGLQHYAQNLGLAFQVGDDLVDDAEDDGRVTCVAMLGRSGAQSMLRRHVDAARAALPQPDGPLGQLLDTLFDARLCRATALP